MVLFLRGNVIKPDLARLHTVNTTWLGKGKGNGICLESRYPRYTCSADFTFPLEVGAYGSLQLSIQPWICAPGTHYGWVDRGSMEYEVCPTLLHMASTGNRTPDLLILSPKRPIHLATCSHTYSN